MGLAVALVISRLIRALLFQVSPTDPLTFVLVPSILSLVTLIAILIPARAGMRVEQPLRYELNDCRDWSPAIRRFGPYGGSCLIARITTWSGVQFSLSPRAIKKCVIFNSLTEPR